MRRSLLVLLTIALVAASAALAAPARLVIMDKSPVAIRGSNFHPGEHVLVSFSSKGDRASKRVRAGTGGGFMARFPAMQIASCAAYIVRATGDEGSHSALKVTPECPQPPAP
jgi:hypothetical protein